MRMNRDSGEWTDMNSEWEDEFMIPTEDGSDRQRIRMCKLDYPSRRMW
jgi:hypothetical protein